METLEQTIGDKENENRKLKEDKTRLDGGAFALQTQLAREVELRKAAEKEKTTVIQKFEELQVSPPLNFPLQDHIVIFFFFFFIPFQEQQRNVPQQKETKTEQLVEIEKKMALEREKFAAKEAELQVQLQEKASQASQALGKSESVSFRFLALCVFIWTNSSFSLDRSQRRWRNFPFFSRTRRPTLSHRRAN